MAENFDFKGDPATPIPAPSAPMSEPTALPPQAAPQAAPQAEPLRMGVVGPARTQKEVSDAKLTDAMLNAVQEVRIESLERPPLNSPSSDEGPSNLAGFGSAVGLSVVGEFYRAAEELYDSGATNNVVDLSFVEKKAEVYKAEGWQTEIKTAYDAAPSDPAAREFMVSLSKTVNLGQATELVESYRRMQEDAAIQANSSWWAFGPGLFGGVALDVAATALVTGGLGAMGTLAKGLYTAETIMKARQAAALKLGAWGMADANLATGLADWSGSRTGITYKEYALATGFGVLFGGVLGYASPRVLGRVLVKGDLEKTAAELADRRQEFIRVQRNEDRLAREAGGDGSGGAALNVSEALPRDVSTLGFRTPVGEALSKLWPRMTHFRAPKSVYRDLVVAGEKSAKKGQRAVGNLGAVVAQFYRTDMTTAADRAGQARATGALTDMDLEMTNNLATVEKAARENYSTYRRDVYDQSWLGEKTNNEMRALGTGILLNNKNQPPTMMEFDTWADLIAQARGEAARDIERVQAAADREVPLVLVANPKVQAAAGEIEDGIRAKVGNARFDDTMLAIDRAVALDDAYYGSLADLEVGANLIPREAVNRDYRPQQAIPEVVEANMPEWKALLLRQFKGDKPSPEWVNRNYEDVLDVEVLPGVGRRLLIEDGENFDDFSKRLPELASAVADAYETARRQLAAELREEAKDNIAQEMTRFVNKTYEEVVSSYNTTSRKLDSEYSAAMANLDTAKAKLKAIDKDDRAAQTRGLKTVNDLLDKWDNIGAKIRYHDEFHSDLFNAARRAEDEVPDLVPGLDGKLRQRYDPGKEAAAANAELDRFAEVLTLHSKEVRKRTGADIKKATSQAAADTRKLQRKIDIEDAKATIKQVIKDMTNGILNGRGMQVPGQLQPISTSKHFKRRAIDLAGVRHDPNVAKFFRHDSELTRELYTYSAGRQANLQLIFGNYLKNAGHEVKPGEAHKDIPALLKEVAEEDFEIDISTIAARVGKDGFTEADKIREIDELKDSRIFWMKYLDEITGEYTHSKFLENAHATVDRAVAVAQTVTTQAILGGISLSFVSDLGMVALSGGKLGVGFKGFLGGKNINKAIKDIAGDDGQFAMAIYGPNADRAATGNNMYDLDSSTAKMGTQGTAAAKFQAGAQTTAVAEGWANMMHPWNRWVRKVAGIGNAEHILKTALKGPLAPEDVAHFSKLGLDDEILGAMAVLTRKFPVKSGSFDLTDITKWADESVTYNGKTVSGMALVGKFKNAIRVASDEALMDPGLGDRPFMRSHPAGRLFLSLSSFMYKAGQTYVSPLIQAGLINPKQARVYVSGIASLMIPIIANEIRDRKAGKEGRLTKLNDPGILAEVLKDGFMRSPWAVGVSGTTMDVLVNMWGTEVNDLVSALTGTERKMLNDEYSRRFGNAGILLGPVVGTAGRIFDMAGNISTKDPSQAILDVAAITPGFNTLFVMLALNKLLGEN